MTQGEGIELKRQDLQASIARGEYLKVYDLLNAHSDGISDKSELAALQGLCMSRLGMTEQAIELLERVEKFSDDPEIMGLLGGFYKRKWLNLRENSPGKAEKSLKASHGKYVRSRETGGGYWSALNAATTALILGKKELSEEYAGQVIEECWEEYNRHGTNTEYWTLASLGEAYLLTGDPASARRWYRSATSHLKGKLGQLKSTRTNAGILLEYLDLSRDDARRIMKSIRKPRLVIFAGHRIDAAGRKVPRFPEKSCSAVKKRLKDKLIELRPDLGIASAADGGDILFHECLMELNRWSHVILPAPPEHFIQRMEEEVGSGWASRCRRVVQEAAQVEVSSYSRFETVPEDVYRLSSDYLLAYTSYMKQVYDGDLFPLVLWDSKPVRHSGGTGYVVSRLRALGFEPESISIDLRSGVREADTASGEAETSVDYSSLGIYQAVLRPVVMIRTYTSGETEEKMASGITRILSALSDITESFSSGFQACGTMGDTFYLLLESTDDVLTILNGLDRVRKDIPDHSLLLHAGIVTMLETSLGGKRNYHCSEIADLQELATAIRKPSTIATMQFRSLVDPEGRMDFSYSGRFTSSRGTGLKIFHLD